MSPDRVEREVRATAALIESTEQARILAELNRERVRARSGRRLERYAVRMAGAR